LDERRRTQSRQDNHQDQEIHNLIFQQILINYFISERDIDNITPVSIGSKDFIDKNGDLNMPLIINRFKDLMSQKKNKEEFLEKEGRFMFTQTDYQRHGFLLLRTRKRRWKPHGFGSYLP
jgi:hypothetical protein